VISFGDIAKLTGSSLGQLGLSTSIAEETEVVHCCDDLLPPCFSLTIRFSGLYEWVNELM